MTNKTKQKLQVIFSKLSELGWEREISYFDDGFVMAYSFRLSDKLNDGCYWEVSIEDHHNELDMPEPLDDWIIYTSYYDPDQKDWDGHNYAASSAIEFKTMKLFMEFVEVLESERFKAKNYPLAYIIENTRNSTRNKSIEEDSNVRSNSRRGTVD